MKRDCLMFALALAAAASWAGVGEAAELSIYEIQSNTTDGDASSYDGQIHDVTGGVVIHKWSGFRDRVYLQDPTQPTWGAICVKDSEGDLIAGVEIGDWVSFDAILIEESKGTTFLQFDRANAPAVAFTVESTGNEVPEVTELSVEDLPVPVDHAASEPYESMIVKLVGPIVGQIDLGKAEDNYELFQGSDLAWGSDYMNVDAGAPYDPRIFPGAKLQSITGIVEQYTNTSSGWDYYQLLSRAAADIVPVPAPLSIYDIQYTTDPAGDSPYADQIIDVVGGVVTHIWHGFNDRVYLRDPAQPTWGAIVVKDGEGGALSNNVSVGDWVSFENILAEEYRGTTFLQYRTSFSPNVSFTIESTGNEVPEVTELSVEDLPVLVDHAASEPYESMVVKLVGPIVGQIDLGKAGDNYELFQGSDLAWGSDYMNVDAGAPYDPRVFPGAKLQSVTGVVEQYTKTSSGWDYYQLLSRSAADIVPVPPPLSIAEIQYTTDPNGDSPYADQIVDVVGGVVTHVWQGFNDRVYLRDPGQSTWGAIVVKDGQGGALSNNVSVGDWISFENIFVEEYRGTTFLQYRTSYSPNVSFTVESSGNTVPAPKLLDPADLVYPPNHGLTEPYESMLVTLQNVVVGQMDLGKADDNYEVTRSGTIAWATDYMNTDAGGPYDPRIHTDALLPRITGIVEQYTKSSAGWDYYQVCTRSADDLESMGTIPTVSEWGLAILALLLITAAKVNFGNGRRVHCD